jgi:hypothetical protein
LAFATRQIRAARTTASGPPAAVIDNALGFAAAPGRTAKQANGATP